jgi:hypothetical protein
MTPSDQRIDELCAQFGWERLESPKREADTARARVSREDGRGALLYVYEDERDAMRASMAHTLDFAAQLFAVPDRIDSGPDWLLVESIAGQNLVDSLGGEALDALPQHKLDNVVSGGAKALRKLHTIAFDGYGDILTDDPRGTFLTFNGWAAQHLESVVEHVRDAQLDDSVVGQVGEAVAQLRHELASYHPRSPAGLVHGRPHLDHIWVNEAFEVVGLTGLHHVASLPREIDIAIFLWIVGLGSNEESIRVFYRAYGAARTMDVQRRERFFKRLAAFLEFLEGRGPSPRSVEELIELASR